MSDPDVKVIYQCLIAAVHQLPWMQESYQWDQHRPYNDGGSIVPRLVINVYSVWNCERVRSPLTNQLTIYLFI